MTVLHNTNAICGLEIFDLTANQGWALNIFSHHTVNILELYLNKIFWLKSPGGNFLHIHFGSLCGLLPIFSPYFLLTLSLNHLFTLSQPFLLFQFIFNPPILSSLFFCTPTFVLTHIPGEETAESDWELTIRGCFFLQWLWFDQFFQLSSPSWRFYLKDPCGKSSSLVVL